MAKNIAVSNEIYKVLSQLKLGKESFSDVIKRLLPPKSMLSDIAGTKTFSYQEWSEIQSAFQDQRALDFERTKKLLEKMVD
ncbi:MAG: antitoxin VapB family protein [Candidatus Hodarchaeales archaeon]